LTKKKTTAKSDIAFISVRFYYMAQPAKNPFFYLFLQLFSFGII